MSVNKQRPKRKNQTWNLNKSYDTIISQLSGDIFVKGIKRFKIDLPPTNVIWSHSSELRRLPRNYSRHNNENIDMILWRLQYLFIHKNVRFSVAHSLDANGAGT